MGFWGTDFDQVPGEPRYAKGMTVADEHSTDDPARNRTRPSWHTLREVALLFLKLGTIALAARPRRRR